MSRHRTTTPYADLRDLRLILARTAAALDERIDSEGIMGLGFTLIVVHRHQCPLRLRDLAAADEFNFWHDVGGITRHFDPDTRRLRHGFWPRFAR